MDRTTRLKCMGPSRNPLTPLISLLALAAWLVVAEPSLSSAASAGRLNILFVMTDDQGYWETGATGNPHIDTPNMDRLAADGVQFRRYYAAPVCSPTRAGVMTGRYYLRTGLYNTRFGGDSLGKDEITIAQLLHAAGYRTGLFGKWHLGKYTGYQPQERGFDEFFGHYHGHIERYEFPDQVFHNGRHVEARGYVTDLFTDAAIDFIEQSLVQGPTPFFCALMYNAPHSPWVLDTSHLGQPAGDQLLSKYLERGLPLRDARIYALIDRVDQNLGRLLERLETLGIADNTLVVFTGDNGGVSTFWKGGMNGAKASAYEGGVRTPCFVRWPDVIPAGSIVDAQVSHIDWLPTLCELAGCGVPTDRTIDGRSLVSLLKADAGNVPDEPHDYVYHTWDRYVPNPDRCWGISEARWKLVGQFGSGRTPSPSGWRLFDLQADPGEQTNLLAEHPDVANRLRREFLRWFDEVTNGIEYAPIPIPVGHPCENPVEISPSWAATTGKNIHYTFAGYDWDTIDSWKQPGEQASWRLDVRRAGTYIVRLAYGCRPLDAGGVVRLSVGPAAIDHTVLATATANQFELREIGRMTLDAGTIDLVAKVVTAPGEELMRLNAILLECQD